MLTDVPGSRRVLVVDDDRVMARTLTDILHLAGWAVDSAFDGDEALERVDDGAYAVVLMDVRMNHMSGVEALRSIRARRPTLPVVLMTAYASPKVLDEAVASGATRVLYKPVAIPELLEVLAAVGLARGPLSAADDGHDSAARSR